MGTVSTRFVGAETINKYRKKIANGTASENMKAAVEAWDKMIAKHPNMMQMGVQQGKFFHWRNFNGG